MNTKLDENSSIYGILSVSTNRRTTANYKYPDNEVMLLFLLSVLLSATSFREMVTVGNCKLKFLRKFLTYKHGIPSKSTLQRLLTKFSLTELKDKFLNWMKSINYDKNLIIAIDGKALRNSYDIEKNISMTHMVTAFIQDYNMVLCQEVVESKSNEITAIPKLLDNIPLKNTIITIDAMGTQKNIINKIVKGEGYYVLSLKKNHPTLYSDVEDFFEDKINIDSITSTITDIDCGHGRIETRKCEVSTNINWLGELKLPDMKAICRVTSTREIKNITTTEQRYYITNIEDPSANELNEIIRKHWCIENKLHWSLDEIFDEDRSRVRTGNAPANLSILRHCVFNLLNKAKKSFFKNHTLKSIKKLSGWCEKTLLKILT